MAEQTPEPHGHALTKASEDYLECILRLALDIDATGMAAVRSVDVSEHMNVSKASVNKALSILKDEGMVSQSRYGRVTLTERGVEYARVVWRAHRALRAFLTTELGVDPETADEEACLMEHALSEDTMRRWIEHLESKGVVIEE